MRWVPVLEIGEWGRRNTESFGDMLANLAFDAEVAADIDLVHEYRLNALPGLIVHDRYLVEGTAVEELKRVIERMLEEE